MSESTIIWFVFIFFTFTIVSSYFIRIKLRRIRDEKRKKEAESLGTDKALNQYPQIDYYRCIGCGACISACPEGGVLGLVHGKATIINGLKCVGHGLCAEACPVNGIKVGLGDIKSRDDIPILSESNQTNLPGIYIAGELGGLALIKNAVSQGHKIVTEIAKSIENNSPGDRYDVVIVGAGPAGLSAALSAKKHNLKYLLIDQQKAGGTILQYPRKKVVMTRPVEIPLFGWLKKHEYTKEELLDIWEEIQQRFNINIKTDDKLENIENLNGHYKLITQNHSYVSTNVILALGRRGTPRKLNVPGEDKSKVMYKLLDAETYKGEDILIVGGGDSAVEAAMGLARQKGNRVTISYRKEKFVRIKTRNEKLMTKMIEAKEIKVLFSSNVIEIQDAHVKIQKNQEIISIPNSYVFIFAGGEPPFPLMHKIGIKFGGELEVADKS
jgi:putative YpdA family bacillithiol system oxidoreductase